MGRFRLANEKGRVDSPRTDVPRRDREDKRDRQKTHRGHGRRSGSNEKKDVEAPQNLKLHVKVDVRGNSQDYRCNPVVLHGIIEVKCFLFGSVGL